VVQKLGGQQALALVELVRFPYALDGGSVLMDSLYCAFKEYCHSECGSLLLALQQLKCSYLLLLKKFLGFWTQTNVIQLPWFSGFHEVVFYS
jgi:hypothetical protein